MATFGQYVTSKILEVRSKINELTDELEELESDLSGAELDNPKYFYAIIEYIDGDDVFLYTEDEEGNCKDAVITFSELCDLVK